MFFDLDMKKLMESPGITIETLSKAPSPPIPSLTTPTKVQIVKIPKGSTSQAIQTGKSYAAELFNRVELQLRRFFDNMDSSLVLEEVDVILNEMLENRFRIAEEKLHSQLKGEKELDGDNNNNDRFLSYLKESLTQNKNLVMERNSNPINAWHGCKSTLLDSICW